MNLVVLTAVLVLSISVIDVCYSKTPESLTCDQLPKRDIPSFEIVIAHSPYEFDYVLSPAFDCSTKVITHPIHRTTNHEGIALNIKGSKAIIFEYAIANDNKTIHVIVHNPVEKRIWYSSADHFDDNGGFICIYSCDNETLNEFTCVSNNNGTSPKELEAVEMARRVPNGNKIHDARDNCPESKGCKAFY